MRSVALLAFSCASLAFAGCLMKGEVRVGSNLPAGDLAGVDDSASSVAILAEAFSRCQTNEGLRFPNRLTEEFPPADRVKLSKNWQTAYLPRPSFPAEGYALLLDGRHDVIWILSLLETNGVNRVAGIFGPTTMSQFLFRLSPAPITDSISLARLQTTALRVGDNWSAAKSTATIFISQSAKDVAEALRAWQTNKNTEVVCNCSAIAPSTSYVPAIPHLEAIHLATPSRECLLFAARCDLRIWIAFSGGPETGDCQYIFGPTTAAQFLHSWRRIQSYLQTRRGQEVLQPFTNSIISVTNR